MACFLEPDNSDHTKPVNTCLYLEVSGKCGFELAELKLEDNLVLTEYALTSLSEMNVYVRQVVRVAESKRGLSRGFEK